MSTPGETRGKGEGESPSSATSSENPEGDRGKGESPLEFPRDSAKILILHRHSNPL